MVYGDQDDNHIIITLAHTRLGDDDEKKRQKIRAVFLYFVVGKNKWWARCHFIDIRGHIVEIFQIILLQTVLF